MGTGGQIGTRPYRQRVGEGKTTSESRRAYILQPATNPLLQYVAYGYFSMDEVLHIPSDQLEWIDDDNSDIVKILRERFPCDHESFTYVHKCSAPSGNRMNMPHAPNTCVAVFAHPAFDDRGDRRYNNNKVILDALYKEAKKRSVVILNSPWARKGRLGFIEGHEYPSEIGDGINVIRFDRVEWNAQRQKRKKNHRNQEYFPRNYIPVWELREIADAMGGSIRTGLKKVVGDDGYFYMELKWGIRTKAELCEAIIKLYKLGVKAFGKTFWRKTPTYKRSRWNPSQRGYTYHYAAKEVVARWKKEKRKVPENAKALEVWKILHDMARAKKTTNPQPYR